MDLAKYRAIFVEESAEHFAEMSGALLELEKNPASVESIDVLFRMAHSIKGMAGSLGYDSITELSHRMEDRMQVVRTAGRIPPGDELSLLFRALAALEAMVGAVAECGEAPDADAELLEALEQPPQAGDESSRREEPEPPAPERAAPPEPALASPRPRRPCACRPRRSTASSPPSAR